MSEQDVNNDNPVTNWKEAIEPDYKEVVDRFTEPKDLAKGYAELLKLDSTKVKIPDDKTSPEDAEKFWSKVSENLKIEDYDYKLPEGQDETFLNSMKQVALDAKVPKQLFGKLADGYEKLRREFEAKQVEAVKKLNEERWSKYKAEWGTDVTAQNIELAKKAFDELAPEELKELMTSDEVENDPILVKMYSNIWRKTLDDTLVKGKGAEPPKEKPKQWEPSFYEKYGEKGQS